MRRAGPGFALCALSLAAAVLAAMPAAAQLPLGEIWVISESKEIHFVDGRDLQIAAPPLDVALSISPDATPTCIAFTSIPGASTYAIVAMGRWLRIVDASTRQLVGGPVDVGQLAGISDLELTACAAAAPRAFRDLDGSRIERRNLFLAGQRADGSARWLLLDLQRLIAGQPTPLIAAGTLAPNGLPLAIEVPETARGPAFQRALFTVSRVVSGVERLDLYPMSVPENLSATMPPAIGRPQTVELVSGPPAGGLTPGDARGRNLPLLPGWTAGTLTNLDTGYSCDFDADLSEVLVHGPGPLSYTVLALDPLADELIAIDPSDCSAAAIAVGAGPVAMIPRQPFFWDGVFTVNSRSDDLTFVGPDGSLTTIDLPSGSGPIGGGVVAGPQCTVDDLLLNKVAEDPDLVKDDIDLTWTPVGCGAEKEFSVWCACIGFPLSCPCICDCDAPAPDPDCACPFEAPGGAAAAVPARGGPADGFLLDWNPGDEPTTNPWKKLESTLDPGFIQPNVPPGGTWFYLVTTTEDPPAVP